MVKGYTRKVGLRKPRCTDLTKSPRGWLRCLLSAGHEADPLSFHHVDPTGPVEVDIQAAVDSLDAALRQPSVRRFIEDPRGQESDDGQVHGPDGWWGGS